MIKKLIGTSNDIAPFVARVTLGLVMFPHGAQKALGLFGGHGFSATMGGFTGMGMPAIAAVLVILGEFLGSLGLIFGAVSRFAAFGIAMIMTGAIFMVHLKNGFFMNWFGQQAGEGYEYHLLAIGLALIVMIKGSGHWSIDKAIESKLG